MSRAAKTPPRRPDDNIDARVALIGAGGRLVELAEAVTLAGADDYGGPSVTYLQSARSSLAKMRDELAIVDRYLVAAQATADEIDARCQASRARTSKPRATPKGARR